MKTKLVALRDIKIQAYMAPMSVPHIGAATRAFEDAIRPNQDTDISRHPEDFEIYVIGEMDQETGILTPQPNGPLFIQGGKSESIAKPK